MARPPFLSPAREVHVKKTRTIAFLVVTLLALVTAPLSSSAPSLTSQARFEYAHGGVLSSRWGAATPRMKSLSRQLIVARFASAGSYAVQKALCYAQRESGMNPGAISSGGDHGLGQINWSAHHSTYDFGRIHDPVYNVGVMWAMSARGTQWGPWAGGSYSCPRGIEALR